MSRNILIVAGVVASLALPSLAQASDASFKNALLPYQAELTTDLVFLAGLTSAPSKSAAPSDTSKLRTAQSQLAACARTLRSQKASSSVDRKAQADMLQGLALAYSAAGYGLDAMAAAEAGKTSVATSDIAGEQREVAAALAPLEAGAAALGVAT
jgi:hypothetical protein